jgi:hypothetical protein
MYGFLGCTVRQFMTRTVMTVTRQTTMRELGGLFEKHDFNQLRASLAPQKYLIRHSELSMSALGHSRPARTCPLLLPLSKDSPLR